MENETASDPLAPNFSDNRYSFQEGVITKELCDIATQYALLKQQYSKVPNRDKRVPNATSIYGDTLMESLMCFMKPHIEQMTGLSLCPSYTYYRVYKAGDKLPRHIDRLGSEIATTVCLGWDYKVVPKHYRWGIYLDPETNHRNTKEEFQSGGKDGVLLKQNQGDCIVFRGNEVEHWRDPFQVGEGSYQVQLFAFYIDKNGPYYPKYAFDQRPGVAAPRSINSYRKVLASSPYLDKRLLVIALVVVLALYIYFPN